MPQLVACSSLDALRIDAGMSQEPTPQRAPDSPLPSQPSWSQPSWSQPSEPSQPLSSEPSQPSEPQSSQASFDPAPTSTAFNILARLESAAEPAAKPAAKPAPSAAFVPVDLSSVLPRYPTEPTAVVPRRRERRPRPPPRPRLTGSQRRAGAIEAATELSEPLTRAPPSSQLAQAIERAGPCPSFGVRAEAVARVQTLLAGGARALEIVGPAGAGKTTVAVEGADASGHASGVIVVTAGPSIYTELARELGDPQPTEMRAKYAAQRLLGGRVVVVRRADQMSARVVKVLSETGARLLLAGRACCPMATDASIELPCWDLADATRVVRHLCRDVADRFDPRDQDLCVKRAVLWPNVVEGRMARPHERGDMHEVLDMVLTTASAAGSAAADRVTSADIAPREHLRDLQHQTAVRRLSCPAKLMLLAVQQATVDQQDRDRRRREAALDTLCRHMGVGAHAFSQVETLSRHAGLMRAGRGWLRKLAQQGLLDESLQPTEETRRQCLRAGADRARELDIVDTSVRDALRRVASLTRQVGELETAVAAVPGVEAVPVRAPSSWPALSRDDWYGVAFGLIRVLEELVPCAIAAYVSSLRPGAAVTVDAVSRRFRHLLRRPVDPKRGEIEPRSLELWGCSDRARRARLLREMGAIQSTEQYRRDRFRVKLYRWHDSDECAVGLVRTLVAAGLVRTAGRVTRHAELELVPAPERVALMLRVCPKRAVEASADWVRRPAAPSDRSSARACKLARRQVGALTSAHSDTSDDERIDGFCDSDTESDEDEAEPVVAPMSDETRILFEEAFWTGSQRDADVTVGAAAGTVVAPAVPAVAPPAVPPPTDEFADLPVHVIEDMVVTVERWMATCEGVRRGLCEQLAKRRRH